MATPVLTAVFLTLATDLTTSLQVQTTSIVEKPAVPGDVRVYAGGRLRLVTGAGMPREIDLALSNVSRTTLTTLDTWTGQLMLLRDPYGLRRWGTFLAYTRTQEPAPDVSDIALTFHEVTYDESV